MIIHVHRRSQKIDIYSVYNSHTWKYIQTNDIKKLLYGLKMDENISVDTLGVGWKLKVFRRFKDYVIRLKHFSSNLMPWKGKTKS